MCILPGPCFPQNPKIKRVRLPVSILSVQSCCWQYWLYFTSLPSCSEKPDPTPLGPHWGRTAAEGPTANGSGTVFPAWAPDFLTAFLSGLIGWCRSCDSDNELGFFVGWLTPLDTIFLDSPLITGNVLYYLLRSYNIHKQSFGWKFLKALAMTNYFFNTRRRARASPDSVFSPVV